MSAASSARRWTTPGNAENCALAGIAPRASSRVTRMRWRVTVDCSHAEYMGQATRAGMTLPLRPDYGLFIAPAERRQTRWGGGGSRRRVPPVPDGGGEGGEGGPDAPDRDGG